MRIVVVDDETILTKKITKKLESNGYVVSSYESFRNFMTHNDTTSDFYLIDISLGDGSGFDIIKHLRSSHCSAPIMILSGYEDSEKIIYGLNIGADDYMRKPFEPEELLARIKAILRRPQNMKVTEIIRHKNIQLIPDEGKVEIDGIPINLNRKEFFLLELFIRKPNHIIRQSEIVESVWGVSDYLLVSDGTLRTTISSLRKKIGINTVDIRSVLHTGYMLVTKD